MSRNESIVEKNREQTSWSDEWRSDELQIDIWGKSRDGDHQSA